MDSVLRSPKSAFFYGVLLASCGLYFGYGIGTFNTFFNYFIVEVYKVTDKSEMISIFGNINVLFTIGGTFACFFGSFIYEKFGRYRSLIGALTAEMVIMSLMSIKSLELLYILRFFHGFVGCFWTLLAPLMIKENLPFQIANKVNPLFYAFLTGGILIGYCFGSPTAAQYWRLVLMFPMIIEIPKLLLFIFIYHMESPIWLLQKFPERVEANYSLLYDDTSASKLKNSEETLESKDQKDVGVSFSDLFKPAYRLQLFLGILLNSLNQLTGINFIVLYSQEIFEQMGLDNGKELTIGLGFVNFLGGIILMFVMNLAGKKTLLVAGLFSQAFGYMIFLSGMLFDTTIAIKVGPFVYMLSFSLSLGGMLYTYVADILPPVGISISALFQWVFAILISKFAVQITDAIKVFWVFFIAMCIALIGGILMLGLAIDTTNKTDAQIKREFETKSFSFD